jgi:hypothetical protein
MPLFRLCHGMVLELVSLVSVGVNPFKNEEKTMKINIEKNLVEFTPESDQEKADLEALWRTVVDCAKFNKKLVAVGQYVPTQDGFARFAIEG